MAKVSIPTIHFKLRTNKSPIEMNKYPIHLVLCFKGRKEKSTQIYVKKSEWDEKNELIKKKVPNSQILNQRLLEIKSQYEKKREELIKSGNSYTLEMLLEPLQTTKVSNEYIAIQSKFFTSQKLKQSTLIGYKQVYNSLTKFFGKKDFLVNEITNKKVNEYFNYLSKDKGLSEGTISFHASKISAIQNYAISIDVLNPNEYCFKKRNFHQIIKYNTTTKYLTTEQIKDIKRYIIENIIGKDLQDRNSKEFGLLFILLMLELCGIAPIDLALLRKENVEIISNDGKEYYLIKYRRKKTNKECKILLEKDEYGYMIFGNFLEKNYAYLLPLLQPQHFTDKQKASVVQELQRRNKKHYYEMIDVINEGKIEDDKIDKSTFTFYICRHSFAYAYATQENTNLLDLANLMGRSVNKIETYLHTFKSNSELIHSISKKPF